jgi:hypothetical protein
MALYEAPTVKEPVTKESRNSNSAYSLPTEHFQFGGGLQETLLHPIVLVAMVVSVVLILSLPRKYVIVPVLLTSMLAPVGQQLVLGGFHLFVPRVLILFGCIRMLWSRLSSHTEIATGGFNSVDKAFTLWATFRVLTAIVLFASMAAVTGECGFIWDAFGGYFLLRFLIRDRDDITLTAKVLAVVAIVVGGGMLNEKLHSQNIFGYLGGVPIIPQVREGSIRAQGPFEHPILAGTFGGTLVPLFYWLWKIGKAKILAAAGVIGSAAITVAASSSTALMAFVGGIFAICLWPFRKKMRQIRWGIVILLVSLHLVMKAPVWFLIARVDIVSGNGSYQRAFLIDQFVRHFSDWWLVGTNGSDDWGADMWDHTNQFVAEGEAGGLVTLSFFIAIICLSFGRIGKARKAIEGDDEKEWYLWVLGAALFSHIVGYFGISYFDQTRFYWFAVLAMISAATAPILASQTVKETSGAEPASRRFAKRAAPLRYPAAGRVLRLRSQG